MHTVTITDLGNVAISQYTLQMWAEIMFYHFLLKFKTLTLCVLSLVFIRPRYRHVFLAILYQLWESNNPYTILKRIILQRSSIKAYIDTEINISQHSHLFTNTFAAFLRSRNILYGGVQDPTISIVQTWWTCYSSNVIGGIVARS